LHAPTQEPFVAISEDIVAEAIGVILGMQYAGARDWLLLLNQ
jgi:hypothetical protein